MDTFRQKYHPGFSNSGVQFRQIIKLSRQPEAPKTSEMCRFFKAAYFEEFSNNTVEIQAIDLHEALHPKIKSSILAHFTIDIKKAHLMNWSDLNIREHTPLPGLQACSEQHEGRHHAGSCCYGKSPEVSRWCLQEKNLCFNKSNNITSL